MRFTPYSESHFTEFTGLMNRVGLEVCIRHIYFDAGCEQAGTDNVNQTEHRLQPQRHLVVNEHAHNYW